MNDKPLFAVHAQYVVHKKSKRQDLVAVKTVKEDDDGNRIRDLRLLPNYQRPFYITKPKYRNHQEKKSEEIAAKCDKYLCTQAALVDEVSKRLRKRSRSIRELGENPFLYGTDLHVTSIIMQKFRERFGSPTMMPDVAFGDFEWDAHEDINKQKASICSYGFEDNIHLAIREDKILENGLTVESYLKQVHQGFKDHVLPIVEKFYQSEEGEKQIKRNFKLHVDVVRLDIDVVRKLFEYAHKYKSDYLAFWNGISDLSVVEAHCKRYSVDMADFMCDPSIPPQWRVTKINKGPIGAKLDAKGNKKKITAKTEWHTLDNIAHWVYVDMMHSYAGSRGHLPDMPYGLDATLERDLGLGKLKLVSHVSDKDMKQWHKTMSSKHIVPYSLYATFDAIGPMLLEDKQHEIAVSFYTSADINPTADVKKNPRCLTTKYHFELDKLGMVCGSTAKDMTSPLDREIYGGDDWIITLNANYHDGYAVDTEQVPSSIVHNEEIAEKFTDNHVLFDAPSASTLFIPNDYDQDLTNSYPMNQRMMNASKATTYTEMCTITGMSEEMGRMFGLNLSSGKQNAMLLCTECLELPSLLEFVDSIEIKDEDLEEC